MVIKHGNKDRGTHEAYGLQILAIITGSLAALGNGLLYAWTSPFIVKITRDKANYDITEDEASYFTVIPPIAMILTCVGFSKLCDHIGRKRTLLLIAIPQISSWVLVAVAKHVYVFYIARVMAGVGDGCMYASLPMYIGEVATPKVRGTFGNSVLFLIYLGQFLINVLGSQFSVKDTAYICIPLTGVFVGLFSLMPESPYFYMMRGRYQQARCSLKRLRGEDKVDEAFTSLKADVERQMSESGTWKDLFTIKSNRKALYAGLYLRVSQQLGGLSVFTVYTQYIFEKSGGRLSSEASTMIYMGLYVAMIFLASFTVDKLGRKMSYMGSAIISAFVLLFASVYFYIDENAPSLDISFLNWIPLTVMISFLVVSSFGLAIVPTLMLGELFSTSIKAKGLTVLILAFGVSNFATNNIFYFLLSNEGIYSPFLFFSVCNFGTAVLAVYFLPETKGKTLEEIQQSLNKIKK